MKKQPIVEQLVTQSQRSLSDFGVAPASRFPSFSLSSNPCKSEATGRIKHVVYEHVEIASCHRHQSFMHGEDLCPFPVLLPLHAFSFF